MLGSGEVGGFACSLAACSVASSRQAASATTSMAMVVEVPAPVTSGEEEEEEEVAHSKSQVAWALAWDQKSKRVACSHVVSSNWVEFTGPWA